MKSKPGISSSFTQTVLVFFLITSCAGTRTSSQSTGKDAISENTSQVIFLNYSIARDNKERYEIELIDKIVTEGIIKMNATQSTTPKEGDLKCMTLDKEKRPISTIIVPDPFIQNVEYQQEDGSLTSKQVILDRADFSVRMRLDSGSRYIAIERINPNDDTYLLITKIE